MLKNYTSRATVEATVARIERVLVRAGATDIAKKYAPETKELVALSFRIPSPAGTHEVLLPARVSAVARRLTKGRPTARSGRPGNAAATLEQAKRTAWKTIQDWLENQLALVEIGAAEMAEVFLPYLLADGGETFFAALKSRGMIPDRGRLPLLPLRPSPGAAADAQA